MYSVYSIGWSESEGERRVLRLHFRADALLTRPRADTLNLLLVLSCVFLLVMRMCLGDCVFLGRGVDVYGELAVGLRFSEFCTF